MTRSSDLRTVQDDTSAALSPQLRIQRIFLAPRCLKSDYKLHLPLSTSTYCKTGNIRAPLNLANVGVQKLTVHQTFFYRRSKLTTSNKTLILMAANMWSLSKTLNIMAANISGFTVVDIGMGMVPRCMGL